MARLTIRLCVFVLALSMSAVFTPSSAKAQMCVRYARMLTGFDIQGDAWMWWQGAAGRYLRGARPMVGSVLVFRKTPRLSYGHVSTVSRVIDRRTILVDHSWLDGYTLRRGMKVIDTSSANNWSSVRVWYEPGDTLGQNTFPTFGFIYPHSTGRPGQGFDAPVTLASAEDVSNGESDSDEATTVRGPRTRVAASYTDAVNRVTRVFLPHHKPAQREVVVAVAVAAPQPAAPASSQSASQASQTIAVMAPRRKPETVTASVPVSKAVSATVAVAAAAANQAAPSLTVAATPEGGPSLAIAPRHKPGSVTSPAAVEMTQVPAGSLPRHKPGTRSGTQVAEAHPHGGNPALGD